MTVDESPGDNLARRVASVRWSHQANKSRSIRWRGEAGQKYQPSLERGEP